MDRTARGRILRHARRLQQHFLDGRIGALRQRLDSLVAERVGGGAGGGVEIAARLVEAGLFRGELIGRRRRRRRRGVVDDRPRLRRRRNGYFGKLNLRARRCAERKERRDNGGTAGTHARKTTTPSRHDTPPINLANTDLAASALAVVLSWQIA